MKAQTVPDTPGSSPAMTVWVKSDARHSLLEHPRPGHHAGDVLVLQSHLGFWNLSTNSSTGLPLGVAVRAGQLLQVP